MNYERFVTPYSEDWYHPHYDSDPSPDYQDCGVISVVYGSRAEIAYHQLFDSLFKHMPRYRRAVVSKEGVREPVYDIDYPDEDPGARRAKLNINTLTPFEYTLYLDADTVVLGDVSAGFQMLYDGWDLVIVPSQQQTPNQLFWHIGAEEKKYTFDVTGYTPMQLQGGVFYFRKCDEIDALFAEWRNQWELYRDQDQAALIRALHRVPVKLWLLGQPFNNGSVIKHRFGQARRHK